MSINIGDNFSYLGKKFLDARQSFDTLEAMRLCSDVPLGFITFCKEDNKRYEYGQNGWVEYVTGGSITEEQKSQIQAAYEHSISDHVTPDEIADFATEDFVTNKIAEASIGGEVDLSGYVTDEELESKGYLTNVPDEYVTDEELNAKGYLTEHQDLSGYVTDEELNAKGYLTEHQDLSGYVTDEELNAKGYLTSVPNEYATKDFVTEKIEEASISGGDINLSAYATKKELNDGLATKIDNIEVNDKETTDEQTALDLYSNGAVLKTIYFSGGGGSVAGPPYISSTVSENNLLGLDEIFEFVLDFNSSAMGRGTAKILINDIEAISTSVNQGENTLSIPDTYFNKGDNRVTVYVIDRTGAMSNNLIFYVRYGSLEITQDFDVYTAYEYGSTVRYYFTPTAVDTSLGLTMYMKIDGEVKPGVTCYSDTRGYFTFPSNLGVGSHYCEAYVVDSAGNTSNVLTFNLIILDDTSLVVASDTLDPIVEEGEQLTLDYKVYMKNNTTFITKMYIDGVLVNTGTCGLATSSYSTSSLTEGIRSIKLEVYDVTETVSDYIIWTVTVTPSTYEMLQPVNAGAMFIATSMNMTNSTENREIWVGKDQEGNTINATLNEFAFNQESGWVNNELLMTGASSVDIPIAPLSNNARYGFTLDIEFASKAIGVEDALVLNLWNDEKNCGIKITTEQVILRSSEGNEAKLYYTDDEMTSVIFIVDRNEATAKIYLNGVMCSAFHLSDYYLDGVAYLEDFTVNSNIKLGGSGHARIKNLRVYQVALTSDEILNNFMANETSKAAQKELVAFQKGEHLPTLTVYCDFSGLGKNDKKPCKIVYTSTDEEKYGKSFILNHYESRLQYQGTSSMAYPIKNYRLNLRDENGDKWYYDFPKGKPECRFTLKADFMSSGHWSNTGLTKWINDNLYNYNVKDEKSMNPKKWYDLQNGGSINDTRECIYGFPCRLILINDGDTPLNEGQNEPTPGNTKDMGIFNFNHDKDATDTMGFDTDVFPNCASYEVTANSDTSAGAFMRHEPSGIIVPYTDLNRTAFMPISLFPGNTLRTYNGVTLLYADIMDKAGNKLNGVETIDEYPIAIPEGAYKLRVYIEQPTFAIINGVEVTFLRDEESMIKGYTDASEPVYYTTGLTELEYIKQSFELRFPDEDDVSEDWGFMGIPGEEGTGLKALIDWVDGCTDEEFVRDFEQHFNKDYTFRYFLLVITLGMVDNLGKNMMLDTWDNKIFMPRFYDCDTICSYDNSGQLKFDVDIEMAQGYWNTSSSRLWTRIRDLFHDELIAKYNNMRQNGLSYESLMQCFYDEQIAKIPQKYYNMDYDVKYAPFADSYIGMANGDVYEHVKRWLQQRLRFVDTLYDYAPSYNNDVLTIRANTTEPMTLYIETYTPVYQHLSWYNNQMDKKKIDGKIAVEFTGTAMAATDQEVLIYGGSNIKSIKGIQSMNPNRMLIGAATKLTELDASNCPLLADVNANKANFAPHVYLNKLDISGCPLLGGNLIVSNSPLLQEIDIRGTAITGLNLPSNLRNLKVLKLPAAISNLTLNDAGQLHTLEFEPGSKMETVSMTNCNALTNVVNFDLENATNITLNNSYNTANELYFSKTTNLSLRNMSNLERVIYTPNAEYETFDKSNVDNASDYKVSVFNSPKCNTFMVTAPYRESYMKNYGEVKPDEVFIANSIDISSTQFTDVKLLATTDTNVLKLPSTTKNIIVDSAYDLDTEYLTDGDYDTIHTDLYEPYNTDYENTVQLDGNTPNIVPSSSDGSLIFSMYAPQNVTEPASGTWDMKGLELDTFHTFGLNNNIIQASDGSITMPNRHDDYAYQVCNLHLPNEVLRYTASAENVFPTFMAKAEFQYDSIVVPKDGLYEHIIVAKDPNNLPFTISFENGAVRDYFITVDYIDTSNCNSMESMFYFCSNLISVNLTGCDTSKVTNMKYMFQDCTSLEHIIGLDTLNTSNVTAMDLMFFNCKKLLSLDLSNFDTAKVTSMQTMFGNCSTLTSLDVSSFDTSNVTNMGDMFNGCNALTSLDVSNFNTSNVTGMNGMFKGCSNLTSLDVSNFNTTNVTNIYNMFQNCSILTSLDVSGFNTTKVTNMTAMFSGCNAITYLDVSNFNTSNVNYMTSMFYNCSAITSLDLSGFNTSNVTNMNSMFNGCTSLMSLNITGWPKNTYTQTAISSLPVGDDATNEIYSAVYFTVPSGWDIINPLEIIRYTTSKRGTRPGFGSFTAYSLNETDNGDGTYTVKIGVDSLDNLPSAIMMDYVSVDGLLSVERCNCSNLSSTEKMFINCSTLTRVNLTGLDTGKVTNMANMFYGCASLSQLDVSNWNTSNVTNMSYMFAGCNAITYLDVSNFDTSKVTNMDYMFEKCDKLEYVDASDWDTSKVTLMRCMFQKCTRLREIKGDFTLNACNCYNMFVSCYRLYMIPTLRGTISNDYSMFSEIGFQVSSPPTILDLSNITYTSGNLNNPYLFFRCNVQTIYPPTNITQSINAFNGTNYSIETYERLFNNLATVSSTQTVTLGTTILNKLSSSIKAIATNKGWTLA